METFSEELTVPGPRLPVTRDAALFQRAVALGRRLLFLHTYGECFVPAGARRGEIPGGATKCVRGIPTKPEEYPEEFSWEASSTDLQSVRPATVPGAGARDGTKPQVENLRAAQIANLCHGTLRVGAGEFAPVSRAVWEFSVSGYEVVKGWLGFRMKQRSGRKSSPLDEIRPAAWTAALTTELLELLWVLEATVAMQPELDALLSEILASPLIPAADFPTPTAAERAAPGEQVAEEQANLGL